MAEIVYDFIVIGAGISGLYAAYELKKQGFKVLILEKASQAGGTWNSISYQNSLYELGPNTILNNSEELLNLIQELEMQEELLSTPLSSAKRYIYLKDKLIELSSSPVQLIKSGILSISGFLRIFLEPLMIKKAHSEESVREFCERKFGKELTEVLVKTFLKGVWAGDIDKLSASIALKKLVELENSSGSIFQGVLNSLFRKKTPKKLPHKKSILSFKKGLQSLTQKIAETLNPSVNLETEVTKILKSNDQYLIQTNQGEFKSKSLVLATQAYVAAELISELDTELSSYLSQINYAPIALCAYTVSKAKFKQALNGFGFLSADDSIKILGSIWSSELFTERALEDDYLLVSFIGGALNTAIRDMDSQEIWLEATSELSKIYKDWTTEELKFDDFKLLNLKVISKAIPQLNLGHGQIIQGIRECQESRNPNLYFVGNYFDGISIKDSLASANSISIKPSS